MARAAAQTIGSTTMTMTTRARAAADVPRRAVAPLPRTAPLASRTQPRAPARVRYFLPSFYFLFVVQFLPLHVLQFNVLSSPRCFIVQRRSGSHRSVRPPVGGSTASTTIEAYEIPTFPAFLNLLGHTATGASAGGAAGGGGVRRADIQALLLEEIKPEYVRRPEAEADLHMRILIEALDRIHCLPSAESALHRRARAEVRRVIDTHTQAFRAHVEVCYELLSTSLKFVAKVCE